jgi:hypothetical protein
MRKRTAAARSSRPGTRSCMTRAVSLLLCFVVAASMISRPSVARAGLTDAAEYGFDTLSKWLSGDSSQPLGGWTPVGYLDALFSSNKPQKYYTTPTSSVVDKSGNVTNYYRGGDTTNTQIIDSYNKTFNTIHNTTNNTNNYEANVKLSDFLNQYTTNNVSNQYTYSADFKSWYYDNTTNNYNFNQFTKNDYTQNNLYYNQDNSRYYISIDNSTDEYYLVDVQYSPTFVTVNYTYNNTVNHNEKYGDVTNVYYYELTDGRNSSTLSADEVAGMVFGYDVVNYELITDDPNTLSLQHFDGDYNDSSSYGRSFYSQNRSTTYVDSGAFGKALSLPNGSAAGVQIPGLSGYDSLSFDFRIYYNDISKLGIYFGDTNIFQEVPLERKWKGRDVFSDNDSKNISYFVSSATASSMYSTTSALTVGQYYSFSYLSSINANSNILLVSPSTTYSSQMSIPSVFNSSGYENEVNNKFGWMNTNSSPFLYSNEIFSDILISSSKQIYLGSVRYDNTGVIRHYADKEYRWSPSQYVTANFAYDSYKNQWVSMRITISGGKLYYFVNGDLVGSGSFTKPTADKFYIKSSGTVYLDELRVTTGNLSSTSSYTPSNAPYDTNKVLALPNELTANTIYVQHTTPVANHRIGGVRPSNPETGYFYIPLHEDNTGGQPQLYDGSNWVNVTAMVYDGKVLKDAKGFKFSPVGSSPDVDVDAKPERPTKPVDPEKCTHEWEETDRTEPTCILAGSVEYTCSSCEKTKTETLPKLGHTWEVKQTVQTAYDEEGNILTQGFTIYRCSACGEEYKDTDGSGPPGSGGGSEGDDGDKTIWDRIADLIGTVIGGLLDGLVSLANMLLGKLADVVAAVMSIFMEVPQLFAGFLDFLSAVFPFVPPDIMLLITFGIAAVVFVGIIKALRR